MDKNTVVVTQHYAYFLLCVEAGLCPEDTRIVKHAKIEDVEGKVVITSGLPVDLFMAAEKVKIIPLEIWKAPMELRNQAKERDLTLDELRPFARIEDVKTLKMIEVD